MTENTKITLSHKELRLVCNKDWILTKHVIIEKVYGLFGSLSALMQDLVFQYKDALPVEAAVYNPKISRGENYGGLPYVMLDYPRYFTKADTLAIRTLFWWGNFFSINLHIAGSIKVKYEQILIANFDALQQNLFWICVHEDPWQHHFEQDNYIQLKDCNLQDFETLLYNKPFVKIAKRMDLQNWDESPGFITEQFRELIQLLQISFQAGEKGL